MRSRLIRLVLLALVLGAGFACTETIVSVIDIGRVEVRPATATIFVGEDVQLQADVKDSQGNPLSGRTISWTSEAPGTATTDGTGLVLGIAPGQATIFASSEGVRGSARITVLARPAILLDPDSATFDLTTVDPPESTLIAVTNAGGGTLTGLAATVVYEGSAANWLQAVLSGPTAPATLTLTPSVTGLAPGLYTATVRVTAANAVNNPRTVRVRMDVMRPAVASIAIAGGNAQSATVDTEVAEALSVLVTNDAGAPLGDVPVTWAVASGGGSLSSSDPVLTNGSGIAVGPRWRLGTRAGENTLRATAAGLPDAPATFTATALPGAAAGLAITTQPPATSRSGTAFDPQPVVQLVDGHDNPVPQAGITVTAAIVAGAGELEGTRTAVTNSAGVAAFADLAITGPVGDRTIEFSAPVLRAVQSSPVTVTAGVASVLAIVQQPSATAAAGAVFAVQPSLQLVDSAGNAVAQAGVVVTAAIASGGGTLSGTLAVSTDAGGRARFNDLAITGLVGPRTLRFTAPGVAPVISNAISMTPGAATRISLTTQPPLTMSSGVLFSRQPVVQLRDAGGNAVAQAGVPVTVSIATGAGTLAGTLTVLTGAAGSATFADLSITGAAGERTLEFTAPGLVPVVSNPIAITTGAGTQLTLTVQPSASAQSGVPFVQQPVVQLRDAGGNPVQQPGVLVTAIIASGGGTLGGSVTATTNASGAATFVDLRITGIVGARVLQFSASGITPVSSGPITLTAGPAAQLSITTQPSATVSNGVVFAQQPMIQLRDGVGNAVSAAGVEVTAAIASGGGALGGDASVATDADGVARFTDLAITGTVGARTLAFTAIGLSPVTSAAVSVIAGPPAPAMTSAAVPDGFAGTVTTITIQVRDTSGNPVAGQAAALAVVVTGANSAAPTVMDVGAGTYTSTYTPTATGTDVVAVTLGGVPISGSPYSSTVRPGGISASLSSVSAAPTTDVVADGIATSAITVVVRDQLGNPVGGLATSFDVTLPGSATMDAVQETTTRGTYMFRIASTLAQTVVLMVTVSGTALADEPTVEFVAGPIAGASSAVVASPATDVLANGLAPSTVTVTLRDAFNNPVTGLVDTDFTIGLGASSATAGTVTETGTGVYTFSVTNLVAEIVTVTVTADGVLLTDQATIEFVAGDVSASNSTATASPATGVTADGVAASTVTVTVRDVNSNPITGIAPASFSIGVTGVGAAGAVSETGNGVYTFTVTSTAAGTATLAITANGVLLDAQPQVTFVAGSVSAAQSTVVPDRTTGVVADSADASAVTVTVLDANGNPISGLAAGAFNIVLTGSARAGTIAAGVTPGTYLFNVIDHVAETTTVTVSVTSGATVQITQQPTIQFVAGPVSATNSTVDAAPTPVVTGL